MVDNEKFLINTLFRALDKIEEEKNRIPDYTKVETIESTFADSKEEELVISIVKEAFNTYTDDKDIAKYLLKKLYDKSACNWKCIFGDSFTLYGLAKKEKFIELNIGDKQVLIFKGISNTKATNLRGVHRLSNPHGLVQPNGYGMRGPQALQNVPQFHFDED